MKNFSTVFLLIAVLLALTLVVSCGDDDDDNNDDEAPDAGDDDSAAADDDADDDVNDDVDDDVNDDVDDDDLVDYGHLIPGPAEEGYDPELEELARMYDRQFHVFNAAGMDLNADIRVPVENADDRELIRAFLRETDGWDFEAYSGKAVFDVVTGYNPTAGLYAGVGVATEAYRYAVLKEQGYADEEVERARDYLTKALEAMHIAVAVTGVPGVIARGYSRTDIPGNAGDRETVPLFDDYGNPLPAEKSNGTWREDNSGGQYPNYIWVDSCSRDQILGWCAGMAGAWEVIRDDESFSDELKDQLQEDARQMGLQLMIVRDDGFDLEIPDADGRTTYHGYLHENCYDRTCLPWTPLKSGSMAIMALGIVATLAYTAEDPVLDDFLYETLIAERKLDEISLDNQIGTDLWFYTNYSSTNMIFQGGLMALRYIDDEQARENIRQAIDIKMYDKPGWPRQPVELGQSLFDFIYASGMAGSSVNTVMTQAPDEGAMERGLDTLTQFETPPYYQEDVFNCDEAEIAARHCVCVDGETEVDLIGEVGWNEALVSVQPLPLALRPKSNYYWRSNPYEVNHEGDPDELLGAIDLRYAYWLGRYFR